MLVTQWQYAFVMHELPEPNPSRFKDGPYSRLVNIAGREILMQPNNPVEQVSWNDAQEFIKRVNIWSKDDNPLIYQIMPNHERYAHIRLPTEAEWEYLVRNRGLWKGPYPDGITQDNLHEYGWYRNTNGFTHPVAELRAFIIEGHPFYDLLGNVSEWVEDSYHKQYGLTDEQLKQLTKDPVSRSSQGLHCVIRGGGWYNGARNLRSAARAYGGPDGRYSDVGFRLVEGKP